MSKDIIDTLKDIRQYIIRNTNKWVFRVMFIVWAIYLLISVLQFGIGNHLYIECKSKQQCVNPMYECRNNFFEAMQYYDCAFYNKIPCSGDLCIKEYIMPNESIGTPEPAILKYSWLFMLGTFILALLINYLIMRGKHDTINRN